MAGVGVVMGMDAAQAARMAQNTARLPSARIPPDLLKRMLTAVGEPRGFSTWIRCAIEEKLDRDAAKVRTKVRTTAK